MSTILVAKGRWNDYTQGTWFSATYTVTAATGALLTSALAIFITLIGTRFWIIVAFMIHQLCASEAMKDLLHYQHQIILRNDSTPLNVAWDVLRISFSWKNRARGLKRRTSLFLACPLICWAAFATAGVFGSRVTTPTYLAARVSIVPQSCGFLKWNIPVPSGLLWAVLSIGDGDLAFGKYRTTLLTRALNYAKSCYGNKGGYFASCDLYPVQQLPYTAISAAPCPFSRKRCYLGENTAYQMSTPWLNSHQDFGINAAPQDRIEYRRYATCSVLQVDDLKHSVPVQEGYPAVWSYSLGKLSATAPLSYTYRAFDVQENSGFPYTIRPTSAIASDPLGATSWQPIPDLNRTDADLSIFFLNQNSVQHTSPVEDPFFAARREIAFATAPGQTANLTSIYVADDLVRVMGCAEQFQVRNPDNGDTTPLTGMYGVLSMSEHIGLNDQQKAAVSRLLLPTPYTLLFNSVGSEDILRAKDQLQVITLSSPLPSDQWQIELRGWFETSLATLQDQVIGFVSKDITALRGFASVENPNGALADACHNQFVRNRGGFQSFSVGGMLIILIVGSIVISISFFLDTVVGKLQRRYRRREYKAEQWRLDSKYHQQRLAFQGAKMGTWEKKDGEVPITAGGEKFQRLGFRYNSLSSSADVEMVNEPANRASQSDEETGDTRQPQPARPRDPSIISGTTETDGDPNDEGDHSMAERNEESVDEEMENWDDIQTSSARTGRAADSV